MSHPKEILRSLDANARKSLSQNFLTSPHWAEKLVDTLLQSKGATEVWEIGPGLGALTSQVVRITALPIRCFEVDKKYIPYLRSTFDGKITVIEGDFLEHDLKPLFPTAGKIAILSNLPYHISSQILFRLFEFQPRIERMVMTFQREFAERLVALPRSKAYGALSVLTQYQFDMEKLGVISAGSFYPEPDVASQAVLFRSRETDSEFFGSFTKVVKAAFAHRRKKLAGNLSAIADKAKVTDWLTSHGHSAEARAEELTVSDFESLVRGLTP